MADGPDMYQLMGPALHIEEKIAEIQMLLQRGNRICKVLIDRENSGQENFLSEKKCFCCFQSVFFYK